MRPRQRWWPSCLIGQVVLSPLMGRLGDLWSHRGMMSIGAHGRGAERDHCMACFFAGLVLRGLPAGGGRDRRDLDNPTGT